MIVGLLWMLVGRFLVILWLNLRMMMWLVIFMISCMLCSMSSMV